MFRFCQLSDLESHWMNKSQRRFVDDWSIVAKYNYYKLYYGMYSVIKMQAILINERMFLYVRSEIHSNLMLCNKRIFLWELRELHIFRVLSLSRMRQETSFFASQSDMKIYCFFFFSNQSLNMSYRHSFYWHFYIRFFNM